MNDLCLWEHTVDGCSQWNYGKSIYIFIHNTTNGDLSVCPQIVTGPLDFNVTIERCPHYAIKRAHTHTHNNSCTLERRVAPVGSECEIELCRTVPVRVWDQSQAFESTDTEMDRQHVCVCVCFLLQCQEFSLNWFSPSGGGPCHVSTLCPLLESWWFTSEEWSWTGGSRFYRRYTRVTLRTLRRNWIHLCLKFICIIIEPFNVWGRHVYVSEPC